MKKYLKVIPWVVSLTACSILIFQVFWVYRTYRASEENFKVTTSAALQRSIDLYLLENIETPLSLLGKSPTLYVVQNVYENSKSKKLKNINIPLSSGHPVKISFRSLAIDPANLENARIFLAKMIVLSNKEKIDLIEVSRYFQSELSKENIEVEFKLYLHQNAGKKTSNIIAASIGRGKGEWIIEAQPRNIGLYFLLQNAIPVVISLFLILLSGACLWYMGHIIQKQRLLDFKKNEFIDNLTHELRTPISILKSTNEALLQFGEASNAEKTARYLKFNTDVLNKLDDDIDRLLNVTRYDLGVKISEITPVDIPDLIETIISKFKMNETNEITFVSSLENRLINTNRDMIDDILTNLVDNAIKYTSQPSRVEVKVENLPNGWQLVVSDNGFGISEDNLELIFDKFYRITTGNLYEVKGYGIGLSYVKQLVEILSGEILVKSRLGEGTTFIIKFSL